MGLNATGSPGVGAGHRHRHWRHWGDWQLDPEFWPDPQAMVRETDDLGARIMISPWVSMEENSENFAEFHRRGIFVRGPDGAEAWRPGDPPGTTPKHPADRPRGRTLQYDPTHPDAGPFLWEHWKRNYFDLGIKTFWLDPCDDLSNRTLRLLSIQAVPTLAPWRASTQTCWRNSRPPHAGRLPCGGAIPSSAPTNRCWTMRNTDRSTPWKSIASGVSGNCPTGWAMAAFEYRQAEEIRDALERHGVRYLFGKSGAILLGFPDTTQDADLFVDKDAANGRALVDALRELGFALTGDHAEEIVRGKDFVQLKNGPFDLDLVFAPDGIERFQEAFRRRVDVEGFPVCSLDDIIASKEASNRAKDRETLPRLRSFREYWIERQRGG